MKSQHGPNVNGARLTSRPSQRGVPRRVFLRGAPVGHRPACREVPIDDVVGRGLVGHHVGPHAASLRTFDQLGQNFCRIAAQCDRHSLFFGRVVFDEIKRLVQGGRLFVHVAGAQAKVYAGLLAFNSQ